MIYAIILCFTESFDHFPHIDRLADSLVSWLKSFPLSRPIKAIIGSYVFGSTTVLFGVSQGLILGPCF